MSRNDTEPNELMRVHERIEEKLETVEAHVSLEQAFADVEENPGLALVQREKKAERNALRFALAVIEDENCADPEIERSATSEEIKEWEEENDEPHPVFDVPHRPERESLADTETDQ